MLTYLAFEKTKDVKIAFTVLKHIKNEFLRFSVACELLINAGEIEEAERFLELAAGSYVFGDAFWMSIVFPFKIGPFSPVREIMHHLRSLILHQVEIN